jgi:hypothetical protein
LKCRCLKWARIAHLEHKLWPNVSQPHFGQVWGWSPTLPKLRIWSPPVSRPQVPCRPTWGSKYATMRKELELRARPRLPALEGVRGAS